MPLSLQRYGATGVGEWSTGSKDNCTAIPGEEGKAAEEKKGGGFFSSMFGGKSKEEV